MVCDTRFTGMQVHGGSLMSPTVVAAMAEAAKHFVPLPALLEKAGARIAELAVPRPTLMCCMITAVDIVADTKRGGWCADGV